MTNHGREAFEEFHSTHRPERFRSGYGGYTDAYLNRDWRVWLAALAHARKQTAELVEAWIRYSEHERDYNAACDARDWQTCENMDVADFEPVAKLLDALSQLKEQPDA